MDETELAIDEFLKKRALGEVPRIDEPTYVADTNDSYLGFQAQDNDPLTDAFTGIARGPVEALKNATVNLADMLGIEGTEEEIAPFFTSVLNKVDEPETTLGKSLESVSGFVSSYALLRGFGKQSFTSAAVKGAAVDMTIWDKEDGRLADILDDAGVQNIVIDYMKTDKDDTSFENGLKNAIEGVALGTVTEGVIKGIAQGYKLTKAKLEATGEVLNETVPVQPTTVKEVEEPAQDVVETDVPLVKPQSSTTEVTGTKPPETAFNYNNVEGLDDEARAVLEGAVNNKDLNEFLSLGVRPQALTEQMVETLDKKIGGDYIQFANELIKDTKDYDVKLIYMKQKMYDKLIEVQDLTKNTNVEDSVGMVNLLNKWNELTILTGASKAAQTGAARATAAGRINLVPKEVMDSVTELAQNEPGLLSREIEKYLDKATLTKLKNKIFEATDIENDTTLHKAMIALNKEDGTITKVLNALVEMRSAGLLSSPVTQGINIVGNLLVRGLARTEDYAAYGIGKVFNTKDRMMWDELQAMSNGRLTSAMETFSGISNAFRKGGGVKGIEDNIENNYLDFYQKYDTASAKSISSDYLMNLGEESGTIAKGIGATIDVIGAGLRLPFHALGITDDMFKRSIYTGQISYIATREANNLKLVGEAKDKYISDFINTHKLVFSKRAKDLNPEQQELVNKYIVNTGGKYHKEALETSRELTFQEEIRSGKSASRINKALAKIDEIRNLHPIGNFVVPFYVTPVNLLKWVGRRTPIIHKLSRRMTDDIAAGGRRKNLAYARLAMGTSLYSMGGMLAASGVLIGGSTSEEERKSRAQAGISDYSIKFGDKTLEVNRFDPLITPLMLSADLYTFHREMIDRGYSTDETYTEKFDEVMGALITSFSGNVLDKTWLKSISDIVDAVKYGNEDYAKQAIASFAPYSSAFRYANQQESYKEASTLLENFKKVYAPSLLRDKLDVFGKPYKDERFAGIKESTITDSPIRKEIARLKVPITKFDKKIIHKSAELELEPEDHWKMQSYVNNVFKLEERLNKIVNSSGYQRLPEGIDFTQRGTKKYMIQKAISETRDKARKYFLSKNKARVDELYEDYKEKVDSVNNKRSQIEQWLNKD